MPVRFVLAVLLLLTSACSTPILGLPGKALTGPVGQTENFAFANDFTTLMLEVNPAAPYSVIVRTTVIDGELYVDAAPARKWGKLLSMNPMVRIKLGKTVYDASASRVEDETVTTRFFGGRAVYRLEPRRPKTDIE